MFFLNDESGALFLTCSLISISKTLPSLPVPCTCERSTPSSLAKRITFGLAPTIPDEATWVIIGVVLVFLITSLVLTCFMIFSSFFSTCLFSGFIVKIKSPSETLSPIFILTFSMTPFIFDGTSTLDLSLSSVMIGSPLLILSPSLTKTSIISTFLKSPIFGTNIFSVIKL